MTVYKLKIFNENPLFCLKINNNLEMFMFFNLQILRCSDFTSQPLKVATENFIFGLRKLYGCLLFRIWYLVHFFLFWMLIEFGIWYIFSSSEFSSNLVFGAFYSTSDCSSNLVFGTFFFHFQILNHFIERLDTK